MKLRTESVPRLYFSPVGSWTKSRRPSVPIVTVVRCRTGTPDTDYEKITDPKLLEGSQDRKDPDYVYRGATANGGLLTAPKNAQLPSDET